ncbi:MAG: glutamate--tRNA ligase [Ferruginibacter sp.]
MKLENKVRVRFAPSPTGGLHLGGVRTVLFNYLFAKQNNGEFILRIEDTDQSRFVEGAEKYIIDCLEWCGLIPDESPQKGGNYGPYRQSERKEIYRQYAMDLIKKGVAYFAFDTTEELELMREKLKEDGSHSLQYDHRVRMKMKNSLTLSEEETIQLIDAGTPYVIRFKITPGKQMFFPDLIRGNIEFETDNVDDKVLLKSDGMPTYHLAVVVDDYLMKISHAFRGEEWLPSAPVHILLWENLFGLEKMPHWAHLPLILKPDGNGKLSKRDGDRLGFPVYAMNWKDPLTGEITKGFKESGFVPQAFNNLLALLGWNDGSENEIFTIEELIEKFSLERVHKAGAKFDFDKAKWFNHEWIKKLPATNYFEEIKKDFEAHGILISNDQFLLNVIEMIKERCTLITDFWENGYYFFESPDSFDEASVKPKWDDEKFKYFEELAGKLITDENWDHNFIEGLVKDLAKEKNIKMGDLQMIIRVLLVGKKTGPGVFLIAETLGKEETLERIKKGINYFQELK